MAKEQPEKLTGTSLDIAAENRTHLKALFPTVFTETRNDNGDLVESIDFEKLKAELGTFSDLFEARRERYGMDWPGKKEALRLIQTPSAATLKPCREESVNFDSTENLFIEGDNLEVLKLLQRSYYGKVKMMDIDPPYNTGKEFIYPDNYSESLETYLEYAGLIDGNGKKFSTNNANEGRFHTKWLNMMYPRLYLARNLLRDDGVIFIHIDDNEVNNLRKLCDEVFGEDNFVACLPTVMNLKGNNDQFGFAGTHELTVVYMKNRLSLDDLNGIPLDESDYADYSENDEKGAYKKGATLMRTGEAGAREKRPKGFYPIYVSKDLSRISLEQLSNDDYEVYPKTTAGKEMSWRRSPNYLRETVNEFIIKKTADGISFYKKQRLEEDMVNGKKPKTLFYKPEYSSGNGTAVLKELFDGRIFDNPKPVSLISDFISIGLNKNDIILDFFSGSGTTAQAVMQLNAKDGGNRKFIMVQLPEPCSPDSEAYKAGYKTIADIAKERIRRVTKKIIEEHNGRIDFGDSKLDLGFRVLKLNKSNFKPWQKLDPSAPVEKIEKQLELHIDHINPEAKPEDLLYEILLKAGFTPTEKIETKIIAGKTVFSIADGALLLCLEKPVTKELIDAVAEAEPMQFICLDSAFYGNDQLKANTVQTFAARNMQKEKHNQIIFKTV